MGGSSCLSPPASRLRFCELAPEPIITLNPRQPPTNPDWLMNNDRALVIVLRRMQPKAERASSPTVRPTVPAPDKERQPNIRHPSDLNRRSARSRFHQCPISLSPGLHLHYRPVNFHSLSARLPAPSRLFVEFASDASDDEPFSARGRVGAAGDRRDPPRLRSRNGAE
ncbi:hypothetical protein CCHR01_16126 [Colletotrichum chrysophilum]|uniref:Uncharacterized protein n=1 Tax=Colletotrichum chrysophilum TaxID=1836956 RepID=A0AAD9A703_9PEZI|nr:hypothetical protein CCHR01_16126 [Colletotrichum chrysophilum]